MQRKNEYKFFETNVKLQARLNSLDLKDLGITRDSANRQEAQWSRRDLSVIPTQDEKKHNKE